MAKYDGLIIPRSYNDYINKSDPLAVAQALQLTGVMDNAPTAQSTKPAKSGGIFAANAVIMASGATLTGVAISAGSVVRVLFTADLTGSDATTGLTLTYNGTAYAVKAGKDGALVALTAHLIEESYVYLQAYTTLELAFDGSQFVVMGNPVVISNADFSIMADGYITHKKIGEAESLLLPTTASTLENKTTLNNRKFSDYEYLLFYCGLGNKDTRDTILVLRSSFVNGNTVTLNFNTDGTNYYWAQIKYVSDTSITIEGSSINIEIIGIKA